MVLISAHTLFGNHMVLPPGARMGPWVVEDKLGHGACGEVYRVCLATDSSREYFAMKVAPLPVSSGKGKRKKCNEARLADALFWEYMVYERTCKWVCLY